MKRRVPSSFDDKDDAGKDKPYNVSERTYSVEVPESYDKGKPAPLFVPTDISTTLRVPTSAVS